MRTVILLLLALPAAPQDAPAPPTRPWHPKAPPLPRPEGQVIRVGSVEELTKAADDVKPGGTILLADGHYMMPRFFAIRTDGVTMRSESGDRDKVVIDGLKSRHGELVGMKGTGITVADLTIQNIKWNGFKLMYGAQRITIYNCVIHNIWQRGVKASAVPQDKQELSYRDCRIQFCLFYNDHAKTDKDDDDDRFGGNYIGGIDVKNTIGWTISDNVFTGIHGKTGEGRAGIYISENGRDCMIERNIFVDCDVAIALGNPSLGYSPLQAINCVARNNFITRCPETAILADYSKDCWILHNTIHDPTARLKRLIYINDSNEGLEVVNNLLSGPPPTVRTKSKIHFEGNVIVDDLSESFVDVKTGNLRLRKAVPGVLDAGRRLPRVSHDIDHRPRFNRPDIGAHEFRPVSDR